jgi:hypothetical protein
MSKKELERMLASMERVQKEHSTREKALALLVEAGIATPDGRLAAPYRNDEQ